MNKRDKRVFTKILKYCGEVVKTHQIFHENRDLFFDVENGFAYRNAIAMPILQIGELSKSLTPEMRQAHPDIPWRDIIRMRDIAAHHYESWSNDRAWDTSRNDVPALAEKVRLILEADEEEATL